MHPQQLSKEDPIILHLLDDFFHNPSTKLFSGGFLYSSITVSQGKCSQEIIEAMAGKAIRG
jgi:hypothetical protein